MITPDHHDLDNLAMQLLPLLNFRLHFVWPGFVAGNENDRQIFSVLAGAARIGGKVPWFRMAKG